MSDSYTSIPSDTPKTGTIYTSADRKAAAAAGSNEAGRAALAGLLGGVASAVGYIVYTRLPDDQKEKLQVQARALVESRVNELRSRFNV